MASIIIERRFEPALTDADLEQLMARAGPCLQERDAHWIRSYLSTSRQRMICLFEAPDAEAVRQAFRVAGLPFEAVWRGKVVAPEAV